MKSTKILAMIAVGGLLALAPALLAAETNTPPAGDRPAGGPPGGGMRGRGGMSVEMLTTNLALTADQVPKVKTVLDEQRQKMGELRNETDQDARRTKMQALRTETVAKMKEILTPEQFAKFEKMPAGGRRPGGGGGNGGPPPGGDKPPQN